MAVGRDADDTVSFYNISNYLFDGTVRSSGLVNTGSSTLGDNAAVDTVTVNADLISNGGRQKDTDRLTSNTTLDETFYQVFCDTDGGPFTVTLPPGTNKRSYRIINSGSNTLTIAPDGSDLLIGANASETLNARDILILTYETTEGWW
jgi:hypothetical protein